MKIMHTIKMVHRDIKEDNIGYSKYYRKWIFLDYGFAKFIDENIGYKTVTSFIGTYRYTTK